VETPRAPFDRFHKPLLSAVRGKVYTSGATIDDACSFAWLQLMRTGPDRGHTLFAWLRTTAVRETIHLDSRIRRTQLPGKAHIEEGGRVTRTRPPPLAVR
jgi:DNA-directed RNA polymerase specialized sigma24 family protein